MESDAELSLLEHLEQVRCIAEMDDEQALDALAEYIETLRYGADWHRRQARETLERIRSELDFVTSAMERGARLQWGGHELRERLAELGLRWSDELRQQFAGDIAELRQRAAPILNAADVYSALQRLQWCLEETIANTVAGERILRDLELTEEDLAKHGELDAHAANLRQARERVARYRWQRKMDEAEIAEAGGNAKKTAKLRAEAAVILRQDWVRAFPRPTDPPPPSG